MSTNSQILKQSDSHIIQMLFFGKRSLNFEENKSLLKATIKFILATKKFDDILI